MSNDLSGFGAAFRGPHEGDVRLRLSGFDNDAVDKAFFTGTQIKSNFICTIGYGSGEVMFPRNPRLTFEATSREA